MIVVDLDTGYNVKKLIFPDTQPHIEIPVMHEDSRVKVICSITSPDKLFILLQTVQAIKRYGAICSRLVIPYLMGARYDRNMKEGVCESVDLYVVGELINSMGFEEVFLYDVHSVMATNYIEHSINISPNELIMAYNTPDALLIAPDKGAVDRARHALKINKNFTDITYCDKNRDTNGIITLTVSEPKRCKNRHCVIVDDLCDGGGTFVAIAEQIRPASLTLIVTHGIFSKGLGELNRHFSKIITSNSLEYSNYPTWKELTYNTLRYNQTFVEIIPIIQRAKNEN